MKLNKIKWLDNNGYIVVTGASKGLGFAYVKELLEANYNIICVSRNTDNLNKLKDTFKLKDKQLMLFNYDLSIVDEVYKFFEKIKNYDISVIINNAGYGLYGEFKDANLDKELNMIDLNIKSLQILTKLFLNLFNRKDYGRIINIASMASFSPGGPFYSTYYATKSYVLSLGQSINTELKKSKSKVRVVTICPGPLKTEFWKNSLSEKKYKNKEDLKVKTISLQKFAIKSLFKALKVKNKNYILVGVKNKILKRCTKVFSENIILNNVYKFQKSKLV
ncbi:short-chain dehydrogenase/reductase SDR [Spiroplasma corruscae]|uniref:Short-chain dehydrogenase/reductase SDR n=1 Tax=Spiroplasma corruscae TaxID=216934 RepID=A0A222EQY2_9MOLU|nr:SDR family NAD(P)-dependent oxidoreductase [Spiroplasma corruscae]ASP28644.1 short-chain dehydrogenase/reductase SDR [Spiroplasma corruscae]